MDVLVKSGSIHFKISLLVRGHLQTDLCTLNVKMTFRGGGGGEGVVHVTLMFRNVCTNNENCDVKKGGGEGASA